MKNVLIFYLNFRFIIKILSVFILVTPIKCIEVL